MLEIINVTDEHNFAVVISLVMIFVFGGLMIWITKKVINFVFDLVQKKMGKLCDGMNLIVDRVETNLKQNKKSFEALDKIAISLEKNTELQDEIRKALNGRSNLGVRVEKIEIALNRIEREVLKRIEEKL